MAVERTTEANLVPIRNFIGGRWVESSSSTFLTVRNPATELPIARVPAGSERDIAAAVAHAQGAAREWASLPLEDRITRLLTVADDLESCVRELAEVEQAEMGRPATVGEQWIAAAITTFRHDVLLAREYPFVVERVLDGATTVVRREPVGVVAVISPWNYPTNMALGALGVLLAAGNTVVMKPSEKTPLSAARLVEAISLPPGVLNLVHGDVRAGAALTAHPGVGLVHFTGSVRGGHAVAVASAHHLRRAVLELGGKDAVVVDAGVDVDDVARDVARGAFTNTGQICTSMERIYVHRDVADEFVRALVRESARYTIGDPSTDPTAVLGPMVDAGQRDTVVAHVRDAVERGAVVEAGGVIPVGRGFFYPPTVLTHVTDDMTIMREETFGPVAPVQVVDSFEEALEKAAKSDFGLAATVYTRDRDHAVAAGRLPVGLTWVNQWQAAGSELSYEPARQSGMAEIGHFASYAAATRPAAVVIVREGSVGS